MVAEFVTFDEYSQFYKDSNRHDNDHKIMEKLVTGKLPDVAAYYKKLKDMAHTARYHNYKYSQAIASDAIRCLSKIKEYCSM
ncbi:MAG: hypothetical protein ACUZ8O_08730 [Candidatus Anammoxibacter sp.]